MSCDKSVWKIVVRWRKNELFLLLSPMINFVVLCLFICLQVKHQKVKLFRANEPILSVLMWGEIDLRKTPQNMQY